MLEQICSVLFLKDPTWELIRLTSPYESNGFFYSFEFDARNSLYTYLFVGDRPPIPHGNFFLLALVNPNYLISQWRNFADISIGVDHADELIYLWVYPFPSVPPGLNQTETVLSKRMLQTWTNVVTYGYLINMFKKYYFYSI